MHLVQKVVQLLRVAVAIFLDELGQRIHAGGRIAQVVDHVVPQCLLLANLMLHILAECVTLFAVRAFFTDFPTSYNLLLPPFIGIV